MVWDENVLEKCLVLITLLFYIVVPAVHELYNGESSYNAWVFVFVKEL